jgi:hypothetical protein
MPPKPAVVVAVVVVVVVVVVLLVLVVLLVVLLVARVNVRRVWRRGRLCRARLFTRKVASIRRGLATSLRNYMAPRFLKCWSGGKKAYQHSTKKLFNDPNPPC